MLMYCPVGGLFCIEVTGTHQGTEFTHLYMSLVFKWRNGVNLLHTYFRLIKPFGAGIIFFLILAHLYIKCE